MFRLRPYFWARNEIAGLDPETDYDRIAHLYAEVRYGWAPLSAAFYTATFVRQSGIPSIAKTLHRGGGGASMTATRKRNDDTLVLFGEIFAYGADSDRGGEVVERMDEIHAPYAISQQDYLYTLCSIIDEPLRAAELVGYVGATVKEQEGWFLFWRRVGERMGIEDLPDTLAEARALVRRLEDERWAHTTAGRAVSDAVIDDYLARYVPGPLRGVARPGVHALLGERLCEVHGYRQPSAAVRGVVLGGLRWYLRARRLLPDPGVRPVTKSFGSAYGACPHLAEVGYYPPPARDAAAGEATVGEAPEPPRRCVA